MFDWYKFRSSRNWQPIQIRNLMNSGLTEKQAEITAEPMKFIDNAMANQAGGFAGYGIPAALILIIQQT